MDFSQFHLNTPTVGLSVRTLQDISLSSSTTLIKPYFLTSHDQCAFITCPAAGSASKQKNNIQHEKEKEKSWNGFKQKAWQYEGVYSFPQDINKP